MWSAVVSDLLGGSGGIRLLVGRISFKKLINILSLSFCLSVSSFEKFRVWK